MLGYRTGDVAQWLSRRRAWLPYIRPSASRDQKESIIEFANYGTPVIPAFRKGNEFEAILDYIARSSLRKKKKEILYQLLA